jgi:hypothetical protein
MRSLAVGAAATSSRAGGKPASGVLPVPEFREGAGVWRVDEDAAEPEAPTTSDASAASTSVDATLASGVQDPAGAAAAATTMTTSTASAAQGPALDTTAARAEKAAQISWDIKERGKPERGMRAKMALKAAAIPNSERTGGGVTVEITVPPEERAIAAAASGVQHSVAAASYAKPYSAFTPAPIAPSGVQDSAGALIATQPMDTSEAPSPMTRQWSSRPHEY